jgi:hypothetical protein
METKKIFHDKYPIEITGMTEEEIIKTVKAYIIQKDWVEEYLKDNDPEFLQQIKNKNK